jgi:protein phosphatase-4 regulatory subunit 3
LDYDDDAAPTEELADEMGDVALKMRQKRQREEDEEEGFAGLLSKAAHMGGDGDVKRQKDREKSPEVGKKIRLNIGVKKLPVEPEPDE